MNDEYAILPQTEQRWTKAEYHEQELIDYRGNPLIEALGPVLSVEDAYERLCLTPMYDEGH